MKSIIKKVIRKTQILFTAIVFLIGVPANAGSDITEIERAQNLNAMYQWLIDNQIANGALPMYGANDGDANVVPYFSSIASLAFIRYGAQNGGLDRAKLYYDWYFAHLNDESPNNIGTIYDYRIIVKDKQAVKETSKDKYDSADSYAALFLTSLFEYVKAGGDKEYILNNKEKIFKIINMQTSLIDESNLSSVSHINRTKYLMDNCEVAMGIYSACMLLKKVYLPEYKFYQKEYWSIRRDILNLKKLRSKLVASINNELWNKEKGCYELGLKGSGNTINFDSYEDFYPDAIAQLFPIVYNVINPDSQRAKQLYNDFCDAYSWETLEHYEKEKTGFYWGIAAYCAAVMGDDSRVNKYIDSFAQKTMPELRYPVYNADIAWVVMAGIYK